ncbi:RNA polymerase sigma factor [Sutcliffiella rhizosphaerae]|uniref:RNA polymerase sigma factor n=1 Tax=Sutcliffiella rhizosphaerae TaxID=2880967 RepID=A0ABM8YP88_9BACI|nr:RNA polymerase sigma factor [Sutcliffiella rhizosphaerae]CAG9621743.1 ECF RNA polymerase sigma factor SigX [Sutcliffiella rhizosphaerae]
MSNKEVISKWFYEYSDDIFQFLFYRLGTEKHDVEDLIQEVFIKALKGFSTFKGNSSPKTWLYSIARNVAIDALRKKKRERWFFLLETDKARSEVASPESIYFLTEDQKEFMCAIRSLKQSYQEVLVMRGIKELSVQETAEILGWSEKKVGSTLYRAKLALHQKLGGEFRE